MDCDAATNLLQKVGGLLNTCPGHMRVGVARAKKNWRAGQISREFDRCSQWSYETSRESQQRSISARVSADELRCKAGSLREARDSDLFRCDARC